jgi:hypothetical protein
LSGPQGTDLFTLQEVRRENHDVFFPETQVKVSDKDELLRDEQGGNHEDRGYRGQPASGMLRSVKIMTEE